MARLGLLKNTKLIYWIKTLEKLAAAWATSSASLKEELGIHCGDLIFALTPLTRLDHRKVGKRCNEDAIFLIIAGCPHRNLSITVNNDKGL